MKKLLLITATVFFIQTSNAQTFDYFGQTPPGDTAVKFAPGIISLSKPDHFAGGIAFSSDGKELYYYYYGKSEGGIYCTKRENNIWTEPVKAPFSVGNIYQPSFSADGNSLYYTCIANNSMDLYKVERNAGGWGEPQLLPYPFNSTAYDYSYTETAAGVGYFSSNRPGGIGNKDIWQINKLSDDSFQAKNLGSVVNSATVEGSSCIARDGSYLIFVSYRSSVYSEQSLWITFNKGNNEWTKPVDMEKSGAKINVANYSQGDPTLSPDGKYLFFSRENAAGDQRDVYWVSTHILVGLKKAAYAPKLSKQIPAMNIKTDSVINYVIPASTFSCEYSVDSLKYTATLSNGSALPSWLSFNAETRTLSGTPKQAGTDTLQITATNADTMSASCTFKIKVTSTVGISQVDEKKTKISPNPTTGLINISFGNTLIRKASVEIYNLQGARVFSKTFQNTTPATIDLTGHSAGIYMVKVIADGVSYEEKIVKE